MMKSFQGGLASGALKKGMKFKLPTMEDLAKFR
jgi:hypothetical protein